ncbi:unnamed protein product, partial [Ectocarpus sp. 12 AP-2014]
RSDPAGANQPRKPATPPPVGEPANGYNTERPGESRSSSYSVAPQEQIGRPIPPELGKLESLQHLCLSQNQLTGPIPPELVNLGVLHQCNLSNNRLK